MRCLRWYSWCWVWTVLLRFALSEGVSLSLSNVKFWPFRFLAETSKACVETQQDVVWCNVTIELYNKTQEYTKGLNLCAEDPAVRMRFGFRDPSFLIRNITVDGVAVPHPDGGGYFMGESQGVLEFHMRNLLKNTEVCQKEKHMRIILGLESTKHAAEVLSVKFSVWDGLWEQHDVDVIDKFDVLDERGALSIMVNGTTRLGRQAEVTDSTTSVMAEGGSEKLVGVGKDEINQGSNTTRNEIELLARNSLASFDIREKAFMGARTPVERFSGETNGDADVVRLRAPATVHVRAMGRKIKNAFHNPEELVTIQSASTETQASGVGSGILTATKGMTSVLKKLVTHGRSTPEKLNKGEDSGLPKGASVALPFLFLAETSKACVEKEQDIVWCNVTIELYNKTREYTKGLNLCAEDPALRMRLGFRDPSFLIRNITVDGVSLPRPNKDEYFMGDSIGVLQFHMRSLLKKTQVCKKKKHTRVILGIEATKHAAEILTVEFDTWSGRLDDANENAIEKSGVAKKPHGLSHLTDDTTNLSGETGVLLGRYMGSEMVEEPPETPVTIGRLEGAQTFDASVNDSQNMIMNTRAGEAQEIWRLSNDDEGVDVGVDGMRLSVARVNSLEGKKQASYNSDEDVGVPGSLAKAEGLRGRRITKSSVHGLKGVSEGLMGYETTVPTKLAEKDYLGVSSAHRDESEDLIQSSTTVTSNISRKGSDKDDNIYQNNVRPLTSGGEPKVLKFFRDTGKDIHEAVDGMMGTSVGLFADSRAQKGAIRGEDVSHANGQKNENSEASGNSIAIKSREPDQGEPLDFFTKDLVYDAVWSKKGCSELRSSKTLCEVDAALPDFVNLCSARRMSRLNIEAPGNTIRIIGITVDGVDVMEELMKTEIWGNELNWFTLLVGSKVCSQVTHRKVHLVLMCIPGGCQDAAIVITRMRIPFDERVVSVLPSTTTGIPLRRTREEETAPPRVTAGVSSGGVKSSVFNPQETKIQFKTVLSPTVDTLGPAAGATSGTLEKEKATQRPLRRAIPGDVEYGPTPSIMSGDELTLASRMASNALTNGDLSVSYRIAESAGCVTMSSDGSECMVTFQLKGPVDFCSKSRIVHFGIDNLMNDGKIKLLEMVVDDRKVTVSTELMEKPTRSSVSELSLMELLFGTEVCSTKEHGHVSFRLKCEGDVCGKACFYISQKRAQLVEPSHSSNGNGNSHFLNTAQESVSNHIVDGSGIVPRSAVYNPASEKLQLMMTSTAVALVSESMITEGDTVLLFENGTNQSEIKKKEETVSFFEGGGANEVLRVKGEMNAVGAQGASTTAVSSVQLKRVVRQSNEGEQMLTELVPDVARKAEPQSTGASRVPNKSEKTHFRYNTGTTVAPVVQMKIQEPPRKLKVLKKGVPTSHSSILQLPHWTFQTSGFSLTETSRTFSLLVEKTAEGRRFTLEKGVYDWCGADVPSRLVFCLVGTRAEPASVFFNFRDENVTESVPMAQISFSDATRDARCYVMESCTSVWHGLQKMNCSKAIMAITTNDNAVEENTKAILRIMPARVVANLEPNVTVPVGLGLQGLAYIAPRVTCSATDSRAVMTYTVWRRGKARFPICIREGSTLMNYSAETDRLIGIMYVGMEFPIKNFRTAEEAVAGVPNLSCKASNDFFSVRILRAIIFIIAFVLYLY